MCQLKQQGPAHALLYKVENKAQSSCCMPEAVVWHPIYYWIAIQAPRLNELLAESVLVRINMRDCKCLSGCHLLFIVWICTYSMIYRICLLSSAAQPTIVHVSKPQTGKKSTACGCSEPSALPLQFVSNYWVNFDRPLNVFLCGQCFLPLQIVSIWEYMKIS